MKQSCLANLAIFISNYPIAWKTFAEASPKLEVKTFAFAQDRGSWILGDTEGGFHVFRVWRETCIAMTSPNGRCVFLDGEVIWLG